MRCSIPVQTACSGVEIRSKTTGSGPSEKTVPTISMSLSIDLPVEELISALSFFQPLGPLRRVWRARDARGGWLEHVDWLMAETMGFSHACIFLARKVGEAQQQHSPQPDEVPTAFDSRKALPTASAQAENLGLRIPQPQLHNTGAPPRLVAPSAAETNEAEADLMTPALAGGLPGTAQAVGTPGGRRVARVARGQTAKREPREPAPPPGLTSQWETLNMATRTMCGVTNLVRRLKAQEVQMVFERYVGPIAQCTLIEDACSITFMNADHAQAPHSSLQSPPTVAKALRRTSRKTQVWCFF
ncbi:unnamed protein product [Durusdinium trenchii]|uniref:Uncharacterized protein n=1 Tax=Durusdinium trenchii TaxID=1381693 RepID=A0ABP0QU82_9DINO